MAQELSKEDMARMRQIHSEFVNQTKADPALAQDLLDATGWNMEAALQAYKGLSITYTEQADSKEFEDVNNPAVTGLLGGDSGHGLSTVDESSDQLAGEIVNKPKKKGKAKGLGHVAESVEDMFIKVAVSESKLKAGDNKKEKVFDEQFFRHSFLYPDLSLQADDLKTFIQSDIIEKSHKYTLTKAGRLNWWASTGKLPVLEPLATTGDGNCLLHAASLYMWGLPDSYLILRTHLHRILTEGVEREGMQRRWRHSTHLRNQEAGGLVFSEEEWEFEWSEIVRIATNQPRRRPTTDTLKRYSTLRTHYESLEEIHVFAMAHVLRRPIIIVADEYVRDMNGEPFAPIYFGGIYLPLECSPSSCYNSPLILAFDSAHFSPLVSKRDPVTSLKQQTSRLRHLPSRHDTVIPLVTPDGSLLPIPFVFDPKKKNVSEKWANQKCQLGDFPDELRTLLESYLDIRWIQLNIGAQIDNAPSDEEGFQGKVPKFRFPAAVVSVLGEPEYQSVLVVNYFENARGRLEIEKKRQEQLAAEKARQEEEFRRIQATRPVPCKGKGCNMFGTASSGELCSRCYTKEQKKKSKATPTPVGMVTYPDKWDIVLPDVLAQEDSGTGKGDVANDGEDNNGGVQLISQKSNESVDGSSGELTRKTPPRSPSKTPPTKPPSKVHSKAPPMSPPRSPPKAPPTQTSSEPQSKAPPMTPPTEQSKAPPRSPPKAPPRSPPKAPPKSPSRAHQIPPSTQQTGYSRDHIQPLSNTGSGKELCRGGCGFFGSNNLEGLCSQCHKKLHPSITQV